MADEGQDPVLGALPCLPRGGQAAQHGPRDCDNEQPGQDGARQGDEQGPQQVAARGGQDREDRIHLGVGGVDGAGAQAGQRSD